MKVLGLLFGVLLGAWVGSLFHAEFAGMVFGGLIGWLLLRSQDKQVADDEVLQEIGRLRALITDQRQGFERELAQLRQRIAVLEGGLPAVEPVPPVEAQAVAAAMIAPVAMVQPEPLPVAPPAESEAEFTFEVEEPVKASQEPIPQPSPHAISEAQPEPVALAPQAPDFFERTFTAVKDWLFGGNTLVRVGVLLVFLGLAFLLRYVSDRIVISVELRYLGVAATALVFLGLGWRLRESRRAYGLMMQGAAVAVMYLTIFAAMRLHAILPLQAGFVLLVLVAVLSAVLAVAQNALTLAVAGSLGGFAAPILASTGGGNHVALFSYIALLNTGILGIAWFKAWRSLNLVGFFGTLLIGLAWGQRSYLPTHYASAQFFLILFFLMFVSIGLLFARRVLLDDPAAPRVSSTSEWWAWVKQQGGDLGRYVDGIILFGPPLFGFGLQYALVRDTEYGAAFSALALGAFYLLLARLVYSRTQAALRLLVEIFLALGVIFASLAIPLGLDAQWTSAAWAVEGAGIYWVCHCQRRALGRAFALLLQLGAMCAWSLRLQPGTESLLSGPVLGTLLLGLALLCNALSLRQALLDERSRNGWDCEFGPLFGTLGLWFLYLIAPLTLKAQGTATAWALAGLATVFVGLRLQARGWLTNALVVQLLAGLVFLLDTHGSAGGEALGVLVAGGSGWRGLMVASLVGLAALCSVFLAVRQARADRDAVQESSMGWLMLFGLGFIAFALLFVLPWAQVAGVWAGCGFVLLVVALWLALMPAFWFALVLELVAGVAFVLTSFPRLFFVPLADVHLPAFAHSGFWSPAVIALAAFGVAWRLAAVVREEKPLLDGKLLALPALIWSALWWALAWWPELARLLSGAEPGHVFIGVMALTVMLWSRVAAREDWSAPIGVGSMLLPLAALVVLGDYLNDGHPFGAWGWLGFALLLIAHLALLANVGLLQNFGARALHLLGCWVGLLVLSLEVRHLFVLLAEPGSAWRWLGWVLPLVAWLLWSAQRAALQRWPVNENPALYHYSATLPVFLLLLAWTVLSALKSVGNPAPLPFIPLLNPLELAQILVLYAGWRWSNRLYTAQDEAPVLFHFAVPFMLCLYGVAFVVYTMAVLRGVHHLGGVAWQSEALWRSMTAQAGLSLAWSLLALGLMIAGHRLGQRAIWITGAVLVAVVVAKLFLIELSDRGGLERIVSFIGVGILLLVVGYFAPLPPSSREENQT